MKSQNKKLRIAALGGAGGMGQYAVLTACKYDFVEKIIIADYDLKKAQKAAQKFGDKTSAEKIDVQQPDQLSNLLDRVDLVISTIGPYYKLGVPVLEAVIKKGCDYIDICDDWEPTIEMLKLNEKAVASGSTAVIGMGASPGISNLLAVRAANLLDQVDVLITGWGDGDKQDSSAFEQPGQGGSNNAAMEHLVHQLTGHILVWDNHNYKKSKPLQPFKINYPGMGKRTAFTVGHPEPITLCKIKPEIKTCVNVMDIPRPLVRPLFWLTEKVDSGKMSLETATKGMVSTERGIMPMLGNKIGRKVFWSYLTDEFNASRKKNRTYLPSLFAYATGKKNGKKTRVGVHLNALPFGGDNEDTMGSITGVPLAVALYHFTKDKPAGVFAPESIFETTEYFDALALECTPTVNNSRELLNESIEYD